MSYHLLDMKAVMEQLHCHNGTPSTTKSITAAYGLHKDSNKRQCQGRYAGLMISLTSGPGGQPAYQNLSMTREMAPGSTGHNEREGQEP